MNTKLKALLISIILLNNIGLGMGVYGFYLLSLHSVVIHEAMGFAGDMLRILYISMFAILILLVVAFDWAFYKKGWQMIEKENR